MFQDLSILFFKKKIKFVVSEGSLEYNYKTQKFFPLTRYCICIICFEDLTIKLYIRLIISLQYDIDLECILICLFLGKAVAVVRGQGVQFVL